MEKVDCVVIGAGVVGLAVAKALAAAGREPVVLEAEAQFGSGTSSRNSEVAHAGIYYTPGSLKARLCRAGQTMLADYCRDRGISYAACGKLIVAVDRSQVNELEQILGNARANGVKSLRWVSRDELRDLEPDVHGETALLSPRTAIFDSHGFMSALVADVMNGGGAVVFRTPVIGGRLCEGGVRLRLGGSEPMSLHADLVVNAAGLAAQSVARAIEGVPDVAVPAQHLAKGHYYAYAGRSPFRRLIYPVPEPGGLGVHATLDMGGRLKFGPDVRWVDRVDYHFDDTLRAAFSKAILKYYPGLDPSRLSPDFVGVRPKLSGPGEPAADFLIEDLRGSSRRGLINLFGIESPGLTASLAIGTAVAERAKSEGASQNG